MKKHLLLAVAIIILAGCVEPQAGKVEERMEVLDVEPIVDYYALGGYTGGAKEGLFVIAGDVDAAWEGAGKLAIGEAKQVTEFAVNGPLNFVIFRGIFSTGGYGLEIEKVERRGNSFSIHAMYTNPGPGMTVTQAFTQPAALIPIGPLETGSYNVKLFVTVILKSKNGDEFLERENEHASIEFSVKYFDHLLS